MLALGAAREAAVAAAAATVNPGGGSGRRNQPGHAWGTPPASPLTAAACEAAKLLTLPPKACPLAVMAAAAAREASRSMHATRPSARPLTAVTKEVATLLTLLLLRARAAAVVAAAAVTTAAMIATGTDTSAARSTTLSLTAAAWEAAVLLMVRMLQPLELMLRTHLAALLMATAAMARGPDTPAVCPTTHPLTAAALEAVALLIYAAEAADRCGC